MRMKKRLLALAAAAALALGLTGCIDAAGEEGHSGGEKRFVAGERADTAVFL